MNHFNNYCLNPNRNCICSNGLAHNPALKSSSSPELRPKVWWTFSFGFSRFTLERFWIVDKADDKADEAIQISYTFAPRKKPERLPTCLEQLEWNWERFFLPPENAASGPSALNRTSGTVSELFLRLGSAQNLPLESGISNVRNTGPDQTEILVCSSSSSTRKVSTVN